jgi:GT2 family glycosyltransferase
MHEHPEYQLITPINTLTTKKQKGWISPALYFSCFLITRKCIEKVGLFDENYFIGYFEDNDYIEQMNRAGVKSATVMYIGFQHLGKKTFKQLNLDIKALWDINREYFIKKWNKIPKPLPL